MNCGNGYHGRWANKMAKRAKVTVDSSAFNRPGESKGPETKPAPEKKAPPLKSAELNKGSKGFSRANSLNTVIGTDFKLLLGMIKLTTGRDFGELTKEGINLLAEKYGIPPIELPDPE